jgi:hypothetical protein
VKVFEVSKDGYEVVLTVRLLGPDAARSWPTDGSS